MAANLDKAESALTTVSDLAYIRGVDASGNSVKISKSDLASVLGALTFKEILSGCTDSTVDGLIGQVRFDNYSGYNGTYTNYMDYGVLLTFSNIGGYSLQLMYSMGVGTRKYRMANTVTWLEWHSF